MKRKITSIILIGPEKENQLTKNPWLVTSESRKPEHHFRPVVRRRLNIMHEHVWDAIEDKDAFFTNCHIAIISTAEEVHNQGEHKVVKIGNTLDEIITWAERAYPSGGDFIILGTAADVPLIQKYSTFIQFVWINNSSEDRTPISEGNSEITISKDFSKVSDFFFYDENFFFRSSEFEKKDPLLQVDEQKEYYFFTPPNGPSKDRYKGDAD